MKFPLLLSSFVDSNTKNDVMFQFFVRACNSSSNSDPRKIVVASEQSNWRVRLTVKSIIPPKLQNHIDNAVAAVNTRIRPCSNPFVNKLHVDSQTNEYLRWHLKLVIALIRWKFCLESHPNKIFCISFNQFPEWKHYWTDRVGPSDLVD